MSKRTRAECYRNTLNGLDAYTRHKKFINDYIMYYKKGETETKRKGRNADDLDESVWEKRLAKKYYDQLYKEYCLANLSLYKEGKIALRWRTEEEVFQGKGQFECGNLECDEVEGLTSWEVNFAYVEAKVKKNALVKLRLCDICSRKLNYKKEMKRASINKDARYHDHDNHDEDDDVINKLLE
ncbi:hypothetical protein ROZALSC1DRAFT_27750 [Rozella allomycis CSF55]|uniref:Folate-sensitive fragile site protein Fra10Ac1 domain-containing protein n=1 Tax=Rozella allomycis (strain CSF55) TaxID=988480 RepID=A0A075B1B5_ROZAC|nr:Folate-sensitive fragile site protein Fra10Ac1 domain-containing protein [Rozella allomycis CSF55]RKP20788.1 hypothetical protein ROZALSC1DRAFT_27750 [Rozella allomycis CSF55]|eukprot:EPZ34756.1 Folate-sensitive fragile site protein Fra10Ac1 domain-containing protein [Rozella allomycis CSF55]